MYILIFNWRDIKNPLSGGAEILTHEMLRRFVLHGHVVTMFTSHFHGAKHKEVIDGINIIRQGNTNYLLPHTLVHIAAYHYYKKYMRGRIDVVIDEIHGIPFFTPFYVKEKKIAFICEVAKDIWDKMFPFPWNFLGKFVERCYFLFYKQIPFMTISQSTKDDLLAYGIEEKNITVLPMGISTIHTHHVGKEKNLTIIFVGRLTKMKGVEDAIIAFAFLKKTFPLAILWIVGGGKEEYVTNLKKLVKKMHIETSVIFLGYVDQKKKFTLMAKAWVIVVPSIREGFGLIVPEANSVGTPATVYNVAGLRDVVKNGINGFIVKENTPKGLYDAISLLCKDLKKYETMQLLAKKESHRYNWENTAESALSVITSK
jgi:glycosyltransferase involved in cell wall biosynthesis